MSIFVLYQWTIVAKRLSFCISPLSPSTFDDSRYKYNTDKSELTISAVTRSDFGEYICMASNKIGENSATFILDVSGETRPQNFE